MQCKVFRENNSQRLEQEVNKWLAENPVQLVSSQLTSVLYEDETTYSVILTLILFVIPMQAI